MPCSINREISPRSQKGPLENKETQGEEHSVLSAPARTSMVYNGNTIHALEPVLASTEL